MSDPEYDQRTILHRDNITRTEIEVTVRQGYMLMSSNGKEDIDVRGKLSLRESPPDEISIKMAFKVGGVFLAVL